MWQVLRLTLIDPTATARLLLTDFQKVLTPVVATLNPRQEAQFHLLEGIFKVGFLERPTPDPVHCFSVCTRGSIC